MSGWEDHEIPSGGRGRQGRRGEGRGRKEEGLGGQGGGRAQGQAWVAVSRPWAVASAWTKRGRPLPIPAPPFGPHSRSQKALGDPPQRQPALPSPSPRSLPAASPLCEGGSQNHTNNWRDPTRSPEASRPALGVRTLGVMPIRRPRPVQGSALLSPGLAGAMEPQSVGQGEKTDPAWTLPEGASKAPGQAGRARTRSLNSPLPSGREARLTPG